MLTSQTITALVWGHCIILTITVSQIHLLFTAANGAGVVSVLVTDVRVNAGDRTARRRGIDPPALALTDTTI